MSRDSKILSGPKLARSHTTFTKSAAVIIATAKRDKAVSLIVLSLIRSANAGARTLKLRPIAAGWLVVVRGPTDVQRLYIYTSAPAGTARRIESCWHRHLHGRRRKAA
jgi:hypothetical protein